jgi:hypothetical protein
MCSLGHRHLYTYGILYCDVSPSNILLALSTTSPPYGFLIDLDLAILLNGTGVSSTPHRTRTYDFIAIEILS